MNVVVELEGYVRDRESLPFDWATSNCCHFVNKWVWHIEGQSCMEGLQITTTEGEAKRLIIELGGSLLVACTNGMKRDPILSTMAQVGDVVFVPLPLGGEMLGICTGRHLVCIAESGEILTIEMIHATHAWRLKAAE